MVFLASSDYATYFCSYFATRALTGFGRLKAINRARLTRLPNTNQLSYRYGADTWQIVLDSVCVYSYRVSSSIGQFGAYDDGGRDYGQRLCRMLAAGKIEYGTSPTVDCS